MFETFVILYLCTYMIHYKPVNPPIVCQGDPSMVHVNWERILGFFWHDVGLQGLVKPFVYLTISHQT